MTGPELIDYIGQYPTLDVFLDRDPFGQPYTEEELLQRLTVERAERALFTIKEQKRKDKKAGVEDADEETDTDRTE